MQVVRLSDDDALPKRVPLHPYGWFKGNGEDYLFDEKSLELIKQQLDEAGHFVVDWHHQTLDQERGGRDDAPAALWIKDIEVDDGYVWGVVESWTPKAAERVLSREYRFISAVFYHDDENRVIAYHSFGLLNRPGTHRQRAILVAHPDSEPTGVDAQERVQERKEMNEIVNAVLAALRLNENATREQVLAKLSELQSAHQNVTALAALTGQSEPTAILGAVQALKENQAQLEALRTENERLKAAAKERRIAELLDRGEAEGKITPADRQAILTDDAFRYMREDPTALEGFIKLAAPKVAFEAKLQPPVGGAAALSAEEAEVAAQLGITPDDFKAAKASYEGGN